MTKCVFCGKEEADFRGVHYIKNDGTVNFLCSSKCRKNALKLQREKHKLKWTESHGIFKARAENTKRMETAKTEKAEKDREARAKK